MVRYIIKRVLMLIPTVLVIILLIFILLYVLPGSRISQLPSRAGGDALDSVFDFVGAGDNLFTKYARYCYNVIFHLNFGRSSTGYNALLLIGQKTRISLLLLLCGVGATVIAGVPLGVYIARRKDQLADRIINVVSLFFSSIPVYTLAFVFLLVFAYYLKVVPVGTRISSPSAYFLPTLTIAFGGIANVARMARSNMLETLEQPYVTGLRAKGLNESAVIYRHALKNILVPIVASLGGLISQMLCGTFVVEHFFNVQGLGFQMLLSVGSRNHIDLLACTVIMTIILVALNILCDILYAFINPKIRIRIKYSGGARKPGSPE